MYIFRGVTLLFVHGPKTYWPASGSNASVTQSIRPRFVNGSILMGLFVATLIVGGIMTWFWSWFANFLAPALTFASLSPSEGSADSGFPIWLLIALGVAIAGWVFAYSNQARSHESVVGSEQRKTWLYVLFWNKLYFDEIYDAYVVNPTIQFSRWLWLAIDISVIDRFIHSIASYSVLLARFLWKVVDIRGIDRIVMGIGQQRGEMDHGLPEVGKQPDATGQLVHEAETRTLQHQLLVMIFWLVLATGILYVLV